MGRVHALRRPRRACLAAAMLLGCAALPAHEDPERVARWVEALAEVAAADGVLRQAPSGLTPPQAQAVRAGYVARLLGRYGPVVGYKAALTSTAAQQRFGLDAPVYGLLLRDMLLPNGARVRRPLGALAPMLEADLIVRVGSAAISDATTPRAALQALDAVIPFVELPALPFAQATDGAALMAANAGAWRGVIGSPIALRPGTDWAHALQTLEVTLATEDGTVLARGGGTALLGDPLRVVLWLREALRADGRRLERGDLLSLGSLTPPQPVPWGHTVLATYTGLRERAVVVRVRCE